MNTKFSVLMSVYYKEKPEYLRQCFNSLLRQTLKANEWVIVEDGKLTDELYSVLDAYEKKYPTLIKRVPLKENVGLGLALREGILHCSYDLIARMDTDDLSRKDRFEKQIAEFESDPDLDICGSIIYEFEDKPKNVVAKRSVPLSDHEIKEYQKKRDAFNHVTVVFKKEAVLKAGNYMSCYLMEDTYLWVRMMIAGVKCKNLKEPLVYVRIGHDMYERRGGWEYFKKYRIGRKMVLDTGYISKSDYYITLAVQLVVALIPQRVRGFVFKKILHN